MVTIGRGASVPKKIPGKNKESPREIEALRARLAETEEALRAIRDGRPGCVGRFESDRR
jgi:hypothetical protein